jgi:hypothetical protein
MPSEANECSTSGSICGFWQQFLDERDIPSSAVMAHFGEGDFRKPVTKKSEFVAQETGDLPPPLPRPARFLHCWCITGKPDRTQEMG